MSQTSVFDIRIVDGQTLQFQQEATFENFIGQFQTLCPKLLCIVDGTNLRFYDRSDALPVNIRFDYKQRRGTLTEYYFRSITDDTLYCVFGREAASIFYPRLNEVDPTGCQESIHAQIEFEPTKMVKHDSSDICRPKRPPIIQPIKSSIPLFREIHKQDYDQDNITTRIVSKHLNNPKHIIVVDKGVKFTFANPNYPIEVKTYYPT